MLRFFRVERNAAALVIIFALLGLAAANSPWATQVSAARETIGHPIEAYLMAGFFLLIGLELKREIKGGELARPRDIVIPFMAALFGALVPALIYAGMIAMAPTPAGQLLFGIPFEGWPQSLQNGWPIPMATDITFALAIFAVFGRNMPKSARIFLLTFAVIDDLIALVVMAVFLGGTVSPWWFVGLLLGLATPQAWLHRVEAAASPLVTLAVLPAFAFFATAVPLTGGFDWRSPMSVGILLRPIAKMIGICLGAWLAVKLVGKAANKIKASDYLRISMLGGIGFTVSLLIAGVVFGSGSELANQATVATLLAAAASMGLGAAALASRKPD